MECYRFRCGQGRFSGIAGSLVERAAPLLRVLLGVGDHVRTAAAADAADAAGSRDSSRDSSRNSGRNSGDVGRRERGADADAGAKEVGIEQNRGWALV